MRPWESGPPRAAVGFPWREHRTMQQVMDEDASRRPEGNQAPQRKNKKPRTRPRNRNGELEMKRRPVQQGDWTGEQLDYLRLHWHHMTGKQIGEKLNKTRNAVLGQVHRLHLTKAPPGEPVPEPEIVPEPPPPEVPLPKNVVHCAIPSCRNTRQPGRRWCATHIRQMKTRRAKEGQFDSLSVGGASSIA